MTNRILLTADLKTAEDLSVLPWGESPLGSPVWKLGGREGKGANRQSWDHVSSSSYDFKPVFMRMPSLLLFASTFLPIVLPGPFFFLVVSDPLPHLFIIFLGWLTNN